MRKFPLLCLILCIFLGSACPVFADSTPELRSDSAILVHAETGRVLFEKNADKRAYPASTTKIMTAFLAIEALNPAAELVASETAIDIDRDGSNMGILRDEVLTVEQLLYGLLVHSANDAANVLAEAVSGSIPAFVDLMNERAASLGMENTHFANAHGYHDENHYTTARDLLKLSAAAMENELFCRIVRTAQYEIPPTNKYTEVRYLTNNNALINPMKGHRYLYSPAIGIKTGYTQDAGACLVSCAEKNGLRYYCVTLNAPTEDLETYSFVDTINLYNYGYSAFSYKNIAGTSDIVATQKVKWSKDGEHVVFTPAAPVSLLLPKDYQKEKLTHEIFVEEKIYAPVKKGDVLGRIEYFYDGQSVGSAELAAERDVKRSLLRMIFGSLFDFIFSAWVMTPLAVIVFLLLLRSYLRAKKRARQRRKQREMARKNFYK